MIEIKTKKVHIASDLTEHDTLGKAQAHEIAGLLVNANVITGADAEAAAARLLAFKPELLALLNKKARKPRTPKPGADSPTPEPTMPRKRSASAAQAS